MVFLKIWSSYCGTSPFLDATTGPPLPRKPHSSTHIQPATCRMSTKEPCPSLTDSVSGSDRSREPTLHLSRTLAYCCIISSRSRTTDCPISHRASTLLPQRVCVCHLRAFLFLLMCCESSFCFPMPVTRPEPVACVRLSHI